MGLNNCEKYKNNWFCYSYGNDKKDYYFVSKKKLKFLKIKKFRGYCEDYDELDVIKKVKYYYGDDFGYINVK